MSKYHIPVMPKETIEYLNVKPGSWYVDCNLGGGGHTEEILKKGGKVIGIDLDPDAILEVTKRYDLTRQHSHDREIFVSENLIVVQDNFSHIQDVIASVSEAISNVIPESSANRESNSVDSGSSQSGMTINGILFDLGVSTHQLEEENRGFSFNTDAPLDMRMDNSSQSATAADLVNGLHEGELAELFWKLGEENFSKKIAQKIVEYRKKKLIESTNELANIILSARPRTSSDRTHPATRIFQALRIAVNDELNSLKEALPKAFEILEKGGRLVVISFHSLEDRIVKNYFNSLRHPEEPASSGSLAKILTDKPIEPTEEEITSNPRSRSGKLRAIEKIK